MIVRVGILARKEGLTTEAFRKYWLEEHGPIVQKIPGFLKYCQNHVVKSVQLGLDYPLSTKAVDGIVELVFDDLASLQKSITPENVKILTEDEARFIGSMQLMTARQNIVLPTATDKPLIKLMSIIRRRPEVDIETFQGQWQEVHAKHVRSLPGIDGYIQNLVIDRSIGRKPASYEEVPIDGISELWFQDSLSLEAAFSSLSGQMAMTLAKTFIAEITTFMVETYQIV